MRIIRDIFWILLIITVPVAIFDKFFRPYCMTVIERMYKQADYRNDNHSGKHCKCTAVDR